MAVCLLLADRQLTPAKVQAESVHLPFAPWTRSGATVIFNAGNCDCLHLYSELLTDMLHNVECNIQVCHNPSICMNMYVVRIYLLPHQCRAKECGSSSQSWSQFTEHSATNASPLQEDQFQLKYPP